MSHGSRLLVPSALLLFAILLLAPRPSSAQMVAAPGCADPELAVATYVDAWFDSFGTNGIAAFERLCLRMCKTGAKGCDNVLRHTVDCNESSADGLFGIDALQCLELEGEEREICLEDVKGAADLFETALGESAAVAGDVCADAAAECRDFCTLHP
jgi:hypothetical protein